MDVKNIRMTALICRFLFLASLLTEIKESQNLDSPVLVTDTLAVRFAEHQLLPDNKAYLMDDFPATCASFNVSKESPDVRDTTFRVEVPDTEAELIDVALIGKNLRCNSSLFVIPLTEVEKAKWTGIWIVCELLATAQDELQENCTYRCNCARRCEEIQVTKRPRQGEDPSWKLCHIHITDSRQGAGRNTVKQVCYIEGGWLILLRRLNGSVNFNREWEEYKYPFGSCDGEFWGGNQIIHELTAVGTFKLRIQLTSTDDVSYYVEYNEFRIKSEENGYELQVDGYVSSSTAGDILYQHNACKFSTPTHDNDKTPGFNYASRYKAPWWYCNALVAVFTGVYGSEDGFQWNNQGIKHLVKDVVMMIKSK